MQPLHLDVARYAFDETSAHLINNRTKSVKDSNEPIWDNVVMYSITHHQDIFIVCIHKERDAYGETSGISTLCSAG